jgi:hypothetical protein
MKILTIDMHPSVGSQLNYKIESWEWRKEVIEMVLDNGKLVQLNPSYVIAAILEEREEEAEDDEREDT